MWITHPVSSAIRLFFWRRRSLERPGQRAGQAGSFPGTGRALPQTRHPDHRPRRPWASMQRSPGLPCPARSGAKAHLPFASGYKILLIKQAQVPQRLSILRSALSKQEKSMDNLPWSRRENRAAAEAGKVKNVLESAGPSRPHPVRRQGAGFPEAALNAGRPRFCSLHLCRGGR